jgi:hypothetical protein
MAGIAKQGFDESFARTAWVGAAAPTPLLAFRPESFFLGRTEGGGVVRDPFGRIVRRCAIATEGALDTDRSAIRFDEVFTYDDGEVDVWRWVMQPGRGGRYIAAEAKAGAGIAGEQRNGEYVIRFRRPVGRAVGPLRPHFRSCLTLVTPDSALKRAEVSLFGAPLGVLWAIHRRI